MRPGVIPALPVVGDLPCRGCKSACCERAPLSRAELRRIVRLLAARPAAEVERLAGMKRKPGMCPLVDTQRWRCSVYEARPAVCRLYGLIPDLQCPFRPLGRVISEAQEMAIAATSKPEHILGADVGWPELLPMVAAARGEDEQR